jgi:membrane protein DedA with SNARE-associated domain
MEPFISLAAGIVGTIVGAAITWIVGRRTNRLTTTFDTHREFNSPEMTLSRETCRKHPKGASI